MRVCVNYQFFLFELTNNLERKLTHSVYHCRNYESWNARFLKLWENDGRCCAAQLYLRLTLHAPQSHTIYQYTSTTFSSRRLPNTILNFVLSKKNQFFYTSRFHSSLSIEACSIYKLKFNSQIELKTAQEFHIKIIIKQRKKKKSCKSNDRLAYKRDKERACVVVFFYFSVHIGFNSIYNLFVLVFARRPLLLAPTRGARNL